MSKFSLFTFDSERDNLLHELQKFEYVHFINPEEDEILVEEGLDTVSIPKSIGEVNEEISQVKYALDLLSKYYERENGIKAMIKGKDNYTFEELEEKALEYDYVPVYTRLRELANKVNGYDQEASNLYTLKEELIHWRALDYPIKDLQAFEESKIFIGTVPVKLKDKLNEDLLELNYTHMESVNEDKDNMYLFALTSKDEADSLNEILRNNGFSNITLNGEGTPKEELNAIDERLKLLENEKSQVIDEIKELAQNVPSLEIYYEYLMNKKLRVTAAENFLTTEKVNVVRGYVPTDKADDFNELIKKTQADAYYLEIAEADKDDPDVPILLKNSKFAQAFESLTGMYALPKYNEVDPTPLLAPFYLAFFGMMVADAGYGVIMLIATIVALKVANLSESQEKFVRFFHYLSYSTLAWGLFFGSCLGGAIPIPGIMDPAAQYQDLLIISIVFGIIHLFFALGIQVYMKVRDGQYLDAFFDVGFWYMALSGGIVFLVSFVVPLAPVIAQIAKWVMIAGMVGIVLTSGRSVKSTPGKLVAGFYELYGISGYVGDFVSYSRLMALGLSGGFIASSINMIVGMLAGKGPVGILGGIVVFVVGQLFNIFLSLLGAYVHTIRLTYVEFFGKFYEGGGKAFNLFRNKAKYINIK